uniref:Uncharacterized protein n=1 Tax=Anguilla anguilla TaxID=7936 RepID=A0A0E9QFC7_ANGAN
MYAVGCRPRACVLVCLCGCLSGGYLF